MTRHNQAQFRVKHDPHYATRLQTQLRQLSSGTKARGSLPKAQPI